MNGRLELRIITQPYSEVYWGYFLRLVFGNSLTKHSKLSSFSYSVVISFLPISHIPPSFHANPPDFPRLIGPREFVKKDTTLTKSQRKRSMVPIPNPRRFVCLMKTKSTCCSWGKVWLKSFRHFCRLVFSKLGSHQGRVCVSQCVLTGVKFVFMLF